MDLVFVFKWVKRVIGWALYLFRPLVYLRKIFGSFEGFKMRRALMYDPLHPVLNEHHFEALDRRVEIVLKVHILIC